VIAWFRNLVGCRRKSLIAVSAAVRYLAEQLAVTQRLMAKFIIAVC
jgi:hypothetical protein